jgi:DNA-binding CsgD family transcriptional regulator
VYKETTLKRAKSGGNGLTDREREILRLVISGMTVDEISLRIDRHSSTIYEHLDRTRRRFGAKNDVQLGVYAICHGLVECGPDGEPILS